MNFNIFKREPIKMGRRRREAVKQTEPFEHHTTKRQNDFAVGVAVGVMIVACSLIYLLGVIFDF